MLRWTSRSIHLGSQNKVKKMCNKTYYEADEKQAVLFWLAGLNGCQDETILFLHVITASNPIKRFISLTIFTVFISCDCRFTRSHNVAVLSKE